jgi:hypothetical protein
MQFSCTSFPDPAMDLYHIALFLHIVALLVAAGATAITKLAASRRAKARTIGEVIEWHNILMGAARAFPIVLVVFVLTGGFMLSRNHAQVWSTGFVVAGMTGVVLLLASGIFLGMKGKALGGVLQQIAANGMDQPAPTLATPPLLAALPVINTMIALSVAFDMVTKPASIATALTVVAVGIVLGAVIGFRPAPAPARAPAA